MRLVLQVPSVVSVEVHLFVVLFVFILECCVWDLLCAFIIPKLFKQYFANWPQKID